MGGGLMQLVAYGAQDIYLTGNPQITFFKVVYRRHTNFSMEAIQQTWAGNSTTSGRCTATISRNGDLVHRMYLELSVTGIAENENNPSSRSITDIELEIGGQMIDRHSGLWMETWAELTQENPSFIVGAATAGDLINGTLFQNMSGMGGVGNDGADAVGEKFIFWVPLQFWFCRNAGLALPLIALQYHEVKVILDHNLTTYFTAITRNALWCDYIYLDTDERRRFAQVSHEYLIEQVQEQTLTDPTGSSDINLNHPVKELIWVDKNGTNGWSTTAKGSLTAVNTIRSEGTYKLVLNGQDRFEARDWRYFTRTQVWEHHTGPGGLKSEVPGQAYGSSNDSIAVYSFALKPEEHQPSGTCNFSRIDSAKLVANSPTPAHSLADTIFAVNYNVLRIMSGMGGLAYSN
jgi:hypothetical protein